MRVPSGSSAMAAILLQDHLVGFPMVRAFADPTLTGLDQLVATEQTTLYLDSSPFGAQSYVIRLQIDHVISSPVAGSCSVSGYLTDRT
jgi:hypothetical protein